MVLGSIIRWSLPYTLSLIPSMNQWYESGLQNHSVLPPDFTHTVRGDKIIDHRTSGLVLGTW